MSALRLRDREELRTNFWRRKLRPAILDRDNWMCHICSRPIERIMSETGQAIARFKSPHPQSPSVDHLRGPQTGFDPRYLRAAHLGCNVRRGNPEARRQPDPQPAGRTQW